MLMERILKNYRRKRREPNATELGNDGQADGHEVRPYSNPPSWLYDIIKAIFTLWPHEHTTPLSPWRGAGGEAGEGLGVRPK